MKLPYKFRGIALLALLVVILPWAAWHFALHDTLSAWRDCRRLTTQLAATEPRAQEQYPATRIAEGGEMLLSGLLLDSVRQSAQIHAVQVAGYEPSLTLQQDGLAIHTVQLTLSGGFKELLQVVCDIERTLPGCRLCTLQWQTVLERRTRRPQLTLTIYLQQITRI